MRATRRRPEVPLLERDDELALIEEAAGAGSAREGRLLTIVAHAGLGKSSLLGAAEATARERGLKVLRARGGELERDFPFGLVLQLLGAEARAFDEAGLLGGAARFARPLLLDDRPATEVAMADPTAVLHGLFWLVSELAQRHPIAILVDDLHWGDELSLRFVLHL